MSPHACASSGAALQHDCAVAQVLFPMSAEPFPLGRCFNIKYPELMSPAGVLKTKPASLQYPAHHELEKHQYLSPFALLWKADISIVHMMLVLSRLSTLILESNLFSAPYRECVLQGWVRKGRLLCPLMGLLRKALTPLICSSGLQLLSRIGTKPRSSSTGTLY